MAVVYITEYANLPLDAQNRVLHIAKEPGVTTQTVTIGGASAQSAAFNSLTRYIRVHVDAVCSIAIDSNPTATTSKARMAADTTEYFAVTPGHKLAVITNT